MLWQKVIARQGKNGELKFVEMNLKKQTVYCMLELISDKFLINFKQIINN